jgi:hypothetical protein
MGDLLSIQKWFLYKPVAFKVGKIVDGQIAVVVSSSIV